MKQLGKPVSGGIPHGFHCGHVHCLSRGGPCDSACHQLRTGTNPERNRSAGELDVHLLLAADYAGIDFLHLQPVRLPAVQSGSAVLCIRNPVPPGNTAGRTECQQSGAEADDLHRHGERFRLQRKPQGASRCGDDVRGRAGNRRCISYPDPADPRK